MPGKVMSPSHTSRTRRNALAIAVHFSLLSKVVSAAEAPTQEHFPAYLDGQLVPAKFDDPALTGYVHHESTQLGSDVDSAVATFCADYPDSLSCGLKTQVSREVYGADGRASAYSVLDITVRKVNASNEAIETVIHGDIILVRSCPTDSLLVTDDDRYLKSRDRATGESPVACVSPDALPKSASLGEPRESGANQCPIGNSPTVGNPINPLTMSKIETAIDFTGPATSGLTFARTYHSGAFPLAPGMGPAAARYPAGARIGARWRHTYDRAFVRRPYFDKNGRLYATALHLVREDGNETRFVRENGAFVPAEGERGTLREDPSGGWAYTWPDLTVEHFDDQGRLRSRVDTNGNMLSLDYDEITVGIGLKATVLVRVRDRQGRALTLGYDRLGRVETLDTPDGRVRYDYSGDILEGLDADLVKVQYPDGRTVQYGYDEPAMGGTPNHKLTGILGGDGKRFATFRYDTQNRAISSAHGDDSERTAVGPGIGGEITISRPGLKSESWYPTFDNGVIRLAQRSEDHDGETVTRSFDYLGNGLVARESDYLGIPTTHKYDTSRKLEVERTEAEGTSVARTVKTTWHPVLDKPVRIDSGSQWSVFDYDARGNLLARRDGGRADAGDATSIVWPDERVTRYSYNAAGQPLTVDGPLEGPGDIVRYAYYDADAARCTPTDCAWRKGDLHTVTDPLGHVTTVLAYDASGRVVSSTDTNGVRTDRRFDAMGRPLEVAVRAVRNGAASPDDAITRWTYTANGDVDTITDPDGVVLTHRYNAAHRLIEQTDSIGQTRRLERDQQGLIGTEVFSRVDGVEDSRRAYTYDSKGLLKKATIAGFDHFFDFDANGRLLYARGFHHSPVYTRDARGRVSKITDGQEPNSPQTILSYDGVGEIKTVVDPKGLSTAYLRNGLGDLLWQRSPDTGDTAVENDANGQPIRKVPADSRQVEWDYDKGGRVAKVSYSDGASTTFTYDTASPSCAMDASYAIGRLSKVTDRDGSTSFCYDFAGRIVKKTQEAHGVTLEVGYSYSRAGRLSAIVYPDGREATYARDAAGRVTAVNMKGNGAGAGAIASNVRHDSLGRIIGWTSGTRNPERTYNGRGAVTSVRDALPGGLALDISYLAEEIDTISTGYADGYLFHDGASRVTTSGFNYYSDFLLGSAHTYTYDGTGNRLSWQTIDVPSGITNRVFNYATDSHRLLAVNGSVREYDATGNATRIGEREFVYDSSGRMSQAKVNGVVEMNYSYNPFGQQVARYIAGETTVSLHGEEGHWLGDYDSAGRPVRQVVWLDGLPIAALDGNAIRDIQTDHLGTPRVVIDRATNKPIWTWDIGREAFGSDAPNEDPDKDGLKYVFDMRFPGQRYDAVTGLFQNGWRDYDPASGRYIQSDPIGLAGGVSTYAYVGSSPFGRIDPHGLDDSAGMYNPGFWGRVPPAHPDYYHFSASFLLGSVSLTLTKSGRLYGGFGPVYGGPKTTVNTKGLGIAFSSGILSGCDHRKEAVDNYVEGASTGASAYYGPGGGMSYNSSGSALETGFGTPGAAYQGYENNVPIGDTGLAW
jgi:RHS repeat-associated protein